MVLWDPRSCSFAEMVIFPMFLRSLKIVCFEFRQEKYFPLIQIIQTVSRAHPSSYSIDIRGTFPRIRRPGHEVDHGTPFSVKVKKEWSVPTPMLSWCGQGHIYRNLKTLFFNLKMEVACSIETRFSVCQIIRRLSPKAATIVFDTLRKSNLI